jgi:hypothetical protein
MFFETLNVSVTSFSQEIYNPLNPDIRKNEASPYGLEGAMNRTFSTKGKTA